jgi:hypothetical protein
MINLQEGVSVAEAKRLIATIPHETCKAALKAGHFAPGGSLDTPSIFWLYCWANNGDNSDKARDAAREVWDTIFDIPYNAFNESVFYPIANERRYKDV